MRAWLFQDYRQKQKLGDKAPWSVGFYDPEGKKVRKRIGSKSNAEKFKRKIEGQLAAGTYQAQAKKSWKEFRAEYQKHLTSRATSTQQMAGISLDHIERVMKPKLVNAITAKRIDQYAAARSNEIGKNDEPVSPCTVNRELRRLKAALRVAKDWGYLTEVPKIKMLKERSKVPTYIAPEDFAKIYQACEHAEKPALPNVSAVDWWRALLITGYMTGWRIGEILGLRRDCLDLERGMATMDADSTKGKRGESFNLHPVVVEHLERLKGFTVEVFPIDSSSRRFLWKEFAAIQKRAGVGKLGGGSYGFHDLRRAFATMNADRLTGDALQALMRHRDYGTTQRYIAIARQLNQATETLFVPELPTAVEA